MEVNLVDFKKLKLRDLHTFTPMNQQNGLTNGICPIQQASIAKPICPVLCLGGFEAKATDQGPKCHLHDNGLICGESKALEVTRPIRAKKRWMKEPASWKWSHRNYRNHRDVFIQKKLSCLRLAHLYKNHTVLVDMKVKPMSSRPVAGGRIVVHQHPRIAADDLRLFGIDPFNIGGGTAHHMSVQCMHACMHQDT